MAEKNPFVDCVSPPRRGDGASNEDELTPSSKDRSFYNFWTEKRLAKKLKLDVDEPEPLKIKDIKLNKYPLESLHVRVTFLGKSGITKKGEKVVNFFGLDETGEVCFVGYRDVAEKVLELVKVNQCLKVTGFYASKEPEGLFNSGCGFPYKLTLLESFKMEQVEMPLSEIRFNFTNLFDLEKLEVGAIVDVIGVIVRVDDVTEYPGGGKEQLFFITNGDETCLPVSVYKVWINDVKDEHLFQTVLLRRATVKEFKTGKKYVRADWNTLIWINPAVDEADEVQKWFKEAEEKENQR